MKKIPLSPRTGRHGRYGLRGLAVAAVTALSLAGAQASVVLQAGFDAGTEGWAAAGNGGTGTAWRASGGAAGGQLTLTDASDGWAYFAAPAAWRQAMLPGAMFAFDLQSNTDAALPPVSAVRVALVGAGLTLLAESVLPTSAWTHYDFVFGTAGGFRVAPSTAVALEPDMREPTAAEWESVLSSLDSLYISADYSAANLLRGSFESTGLDNVRLEATLPAQVPEPGTLALLGAAFLSERLARRRGSSKPSPTLVAGLLAAALAGGAAAQETPTLHSAHQAYYHGQFARALAQYQTLAALGHAEAAERAGFMLMHGDTLCGAQPVTRDLAQARLLLVQAANAQRPGAAFLLNLLELAD